MKCLKDTADLQKAEELIPDILPNYPNRFYKIKRRGFFPKGLRLCQK
jgi:hypothetical protein